MTTTYRSASEAFHAYGLAGAELHRAAERREAEHERGLAATARMQPGRISIIRQWLGDALVGAGTRVAGTAANARGTGRHILPRVDTV